MDQVSLEKRLKWIESEAKRLAFESDRLRARLGELEKRLAEAKDEQLPLRNLGY